LEGVAVRTAFTWIFAIFALIGCSDGPIELIPGAFALPGGGLEGEQVSVNSWSEVVNADGILDLETRPSDPYSVRIGFVLKGGSLYVDPTAERVWNANMQADPRVRVRVDGRIYLATAVQVTDAEERESFDADRAVYRLDLRR
jgi:hypothetical protein